MEVREVMHTPAVTTTARETLSSAAARMLEYGISALAVVDDDGTLSGIVTERDLLRAMVDGCSPRSASVTRYLSRPPVTVEPETDGAVAARLMAQFAVRHLPVCRAGRPVGMLAARDLLLVDVWSHDAAATSLRP
jgi:signal-transduction protein with cAMP-binding, CBS, and nucleotidyltransferase domain